MSPPQEMKMQKQKQPFHLGTGCHPRSIVSFHPDPPKDLLATSRSLNTIRAAAWRTDCNRQSWRTESMLMLATVCSLIACSPSLWLNDSVPSLPCHLLITKYYKYCILTYVMYSIVLDDVQYNASSSVFHALFLANRWASVVYCYILTMTYKYHFKIS